MKPWQAPSNKTPSKRSNKVQRERERERERTQVRARKSKTQSGSQRGTDGKKKTLQMNDARQLPDMFSCMTKEQEFFCSSYVTRGRDKRQETLVHCPFHL